MTHAAGVFFVGGVMNNKGVLAEYKGNLYVWIKRSGIPALIPFIDGMAICTFEKSKKQYLKIEDVISWHESELIESGGKSGSKVVADGLRKIKEQHAAGLLPTEDAT